MSSEVSAHPPRYMKVVYENETLRVTILHISPARSFHYIYKIDVEKNDVIVVSQLYQNQPRFFFNTYTFNLTASTGDDITVIAYCVLFGSSTRSITIL